ncbi:MAG: glutamate-5-semialdehyde dehydrogenase [Nitrospinaceae bacterium]|nr:glutamate-5-semialdehyde dehydrogenase [Nitrospinaceae bacterium]
MADIEAICSGARHAALVLAPMSLKERNDALEAMAFAIEAKSAKILEANAADLKAAEAALASGEMSQSVFKRLALNEAKIGEMARGIRAVAALSDPLGSISYATLLDDGLRLVRVGCPLGVIAAIFESRPDALVQIASLCVKSGNVAILKGGREAIHSNRKLTEVLRQAISKAGNIPADAIQQVEAREDIAALLSRDDSIDLIIPRGSNEFVAHIKEHSRIPVLGHADGICHIYVDKAADIEMAINLAVDSKTQYVAVCNAIETMLVHRDVALDFLPRVAEALMARGVEVRGCELTRKILPEAVVAKELDWKSEYLDLILSIRVVAGPEDAIAHINNYGSHPTEAIVTKDEGIARLFLDRVDAASVMWNASTRFADGYRFGLGAEVGIATDKIHARGPVGLEGLTIYKYQLIGDGHVVSDYSGENAKPFLHRPLPLGDEAQ